MFITLLLFQLQTAILNASSGVVQSLANQANIPASLLSSALINANMAATLSATGGVMNPGNICLFVSASPRKYYIFTVRVGV